MTNLRKSKSLPVYIVEPHNDVVRYIHRSIASKILPFDDIVVIHLDSHPDLLLPVHLDADVVFKSRELIENLSIENWILPLTYAKHVSHIVWVKPPWANQIKASELNFTIGKCSQSGKIRLNCKENYFLTDGLFRPMQKLEECSNVRLTVAELRPDQWSELEHRSSTHETKKEPNVVSEQSCLFSSYQKWGPHLNDLLNGRPYILDIDLDFFSTANPFRGFLAAEAEQALRRLYGYQALCDTTDQTLLQFSKKRESQLDELEDIFCQLENEYHVKSDQQKALSLDDLMEIEAISHSSLDKQLLEDILLICNSVLLDPKYREVTFLQVHNFGCTLDDTELPHHISTEEQVSSLLNTFKNLLELVPRPTIVTIARSSLDGYCPLNAVDQYQRDVLKILENQYGSLLLTQDYD
ncbi:UPF0489 protein [Biomphalaria glabrata]|uniref:UPF0489 protein C5orf22 homolog n=1 Tax=Biomphalaria glabrata TaxID=6526 RepID=A0A9W3ATM0_BIOGL|nr:UPF0489 protein C5orf22 homolog [Biomphalaria glabrata]XP_055890559.1 UPF0489 protein C5orf22 homolog [Biomphalaria glabrata]XP_055890560.1 UPF0489 protein C5orf22 homolog [Biomphalaria glabrata]XP_055890561.1 UPF0489 protein C5orf22 homolog [Biomphalaria glabrata]KAI8762849.1 putative UPF0489 protein C5orf22 [Biomphalaria glabrata]